MNTVPQQVTERYVSNLIHYGRNKEFDLDDVTMKPSTDEGEIVGWYFKVALLDSTREKRQIAVGATIAQAVRRALEKHGVTFR